METPTNYRDKARELLPQHATQDGTGKWRLATSPHYPRTEQNALAVIEACLRLDIEIDDTIGAESWLKVITRLDDIEARFAAFDQPAKEPT